MKLRNIETGDIEFLRHGPATDAVTAGTHVFVNEDSIDPPPEAGQATVPAVIVPEGTIVIPEAASPDVLTVTAESDIGATTAVRRPAR